MALVNYKISNQVSSILPMEVKAKAIMARNFLFTLILDNI